jgi:cytochrome c biogenesis factor
MDRTFNRRLLSWAHSLLALITGFVCSNALSLTRVDFSSRGVLLTATLLAPALVPYLVSSVNSQRVVVGDHRWRLVSFILVLGAGCALVCCLIAGRLGKVEVIDVIKALALQAVVYVGATEFLLNVD